jgi:hypothetical protein
VVGNNISQEFEPENTHGGKQDPFGCDSLFGTNKP